MSAFNKLIEFVGKLPEALQPEYRQLIDNYISERDRLQNERIGQNMATTGNFEVVAIAGTAETLLNDEINVGDTVECVSEFALPQDTEVGVIIPCGYKATVEGVYGGCISLPYSEYLYKKSDFRKVSTPLYNPHQTVEGC